MTPGFDAAAAAGNLTGLADEEDEPEAIVLNVPASCSDDAPTSERR
jgi:hypothetical protein